MRRGSGSLIRNATFSATTHDKFCLMGINGCGKTTLFKLILKSLTPQSGNVYLNENVSFRYLPQGLKGFWSHDRLLDNFKDVNLSETEIRQFLGAALIRKDKVYEPLSCFSFGELMRCAIVRCILEQTEFLFLDEPTSHLDIETIEVLEHMLGQFQGGFMIISHDRSFVSNVSDNVYIFNQGGMGYM